MRLLLLLWLLGLAPGSPPPAAAHATPSATASPVTPEAFFSRRALRRARLLIQMRMLQLRDDRLECVREIILRRLPPDLRPDEPSPSPLRRKTNAERLGAPKLSGVLSPAA